MIRFNKYLLLSMSLLLTVLLLVLIAVNKYEWIPLKQEVLGRSLFNWNISIASKTSYIKYFFILVLFLTLIFKFDIKWKFATVFVIIIGYWISHILYDFITPW